MADLEEDDISQATVERSVDGSGSLVVTISGEVDMSNVQSVEAKLRAVLGEPHDLVVIDLSALSFIDSSGIAALLRIAERVDRLEIRNPSSTVQRIIEATGLTDVLRLES
jgi:anti-sigma B factor antagonist